MLPSVGELSVRTRIAAQLLTGWKKLAKKVSRRGTSWSVEGAHTGFRLRSIWLTSFFSDCMCRGALRSNQVTHQHFCMSPLVQQAAHEGRPPPPRPPSAVEIPMSVMAPIMAAMSALPATPPATAKQSSFSAPSSRAPPSAPVDSAEPATPPAVPRDSDPAPLSGPPSATATAANEPASTSTGPATVVATLAPSSTSDDEAPPSPQSTVVGTAAALVAGGMKDPSALYEAVMMAIRQAGAEERPLTLKGIDFAVPKGSLAMIVGPVGSGKSSIASALLGEITKVSGDVVVGGRVSYCAQQAWITSASVRENILFGLPYDEERYLRAVRVCALEPDLRTFAAGDQTAVGEKGITLSGGQKQRISLARSVYSEREVYLWDDPLSAVDAHVSKHIFEQAIRGALRGRTIILITNQLQYLEFADQVIVMKDGAIEAKGLHCPPELLVALRDAMFDLLSGASAQYVAQTALRQ